jgi:hypothetical protein
MACNDFILTACMHNIHAWGFLACYKLDVGGEMVTKGHKVRIWEEDDSVLSSG